MSAPVEQPTPSNADLPQEQATVAPMEAQQPEPVDCVPSSVLSLDTQGFLNDTYNAVCEYAAEEYDDMERYILENFILTDERRAQVTQGINVLHEATQRRITHNMAAFEEFAKLYAFYVPQGLMPAAPTPDAAVSTAAADADAVQAAMAELVATRRALITVKTQNARLRQRVAMLQAEMQTHSGVPPTVQRVLDVLAAKENVGEELASAGALARKLAPRLTAAQQVVRRGLDAGGQAGPADKEVFRRQATRPPLSVQQLDQLGKQLMA